MTQNIKDLHVYLRSIRPDERTSLSVLSGLVHDGATVLDLGCGSGALGTYLRETRNCTVDGLTWSVKMRRYPATVAASRSNPSSQRRA